MTLVLETADDVLGRCAPLGLQIGLEARAAVQNDLDELRRRPQATVAVWQNG